MSLKKKKKEEGEKKTLTGNLEAGNSWNDRKVQPESKTREKKIINNWQSKEVCRFEEVENSNFVSSIFRRYTSVKCLKMFTHQESTSLKVILLNWGIIFPSQLECINFMKCIACHSYWEIPNKSITSWIWKLGLFRK